MNHIKNIKILAALVIMIAILFPGSTMGASIPSFLTQGWIGSGQVETVNLLEKPHIWEYSGTKGTRAVIAVVAEEGAAFPEVFLFAPEKSECIARAQVNGSRSLVIDTTLEKSGKYLILIRPKQGEKGIGYRLALTEIPRDEEYCILPDNAEGKVITADNVIEQEEPDMFKWSMVLVTPYIVLPYMVTNIGLTMYSAVGSAVDRFNVPGYKLYDKIVHYYEDKISPSTKSIADDNKGDIHDNIVQK